jgi:hypothetical protein
MKTTEEFIEEGTHIHGDKYTYNKTIYSGCKTILTITCINHGDFQITPTQFLIGRGCGACGILKRAKSNTKTTEQFVTEIKHIDTDNMYSFDKTIYTSCKNPVIITCKKHGDFELLATYMLNGQGCPDCGQERKAEVFKKPLELYLNQAIRVHDNKFDYSKVIYKNNKTDIIIVCKLHGEFAQNPISHIRGHNGC